MRQVFYYKMRRLLPIATVHCESEIIDLDLNNSNQEYLDIIIRNYEKHPNTQIIKQKFRITRKFSFQLCIQGGGQKDNKRFGKIINLCEEKFQQKH